MNTLSIAFIMTLIISCGGTTSTTNHGNKTPIPITHIVRDAQACNDSSNVWKKLTNSYEVGQRTIDIFNSITFQSLSTDTKDIDLFYKNVTKSILARPDDAMDVKIGYVPKLDGTNDNNKGFIIQASGGFLNSGYYYVKIDSKCYRGEFPSIDTPKDNDIYKSVKLVVD